MPTIIIYRTFCTVYFFINQQ